MKRGPGRVACIAALVAACFFTASAPGIAAEKTPTASRVVIILAPYLTWSDVTPTSTPTLWRLAETGAIGDVNARQRVGEGAGEPASPIESALAISAGDWAQPDYSANAAYNATETYAESTTAEVAYTRLFGATMDGAHLGYLGLPQVARSNVAKSNDVVLGTLGRSVRDSAGLTAAVGNSDAGTQNGLPKLVRPAAIVAMDESGLVQFGDVSADLLRSAPEAPYGVATDLSAFQFAFDRVDAFAIGHRGPGLIVLDPGDLYRAQRFLPQVTADVAVRQHRAALRTLDAVVALAEKNRGADGVVMVVSQAQSSDASGKLAGIGPIVVAGRGWSGYVTSASTHRTGIVTNLDITATALSVLGIPRPVQVVGNPMLPVSGPASAAQRAAHLSALNSAAISIDEPKAEVLDAFIWAYVVLLALAALVLSQWRRWKPRTTRMSVGVLEAFTLLVLAVPVANWLMFVVTPMPSGQAVSIASLTGTSLALWALALLAWRRFGMRVPVLGLCLLTTVVLVVDQWFGAPLSFSNFFGYSPLMAARFYGMGNEAAALVLGSALVGAALAFDEWPDAAWSAAARRWGLPLLGAIVVVTAAAPTLGANVGVAIWGTAGFVLAWALTNGYRVTWKTALVAIVIVVVLITAFSAIDLLGHGEQTHLARSLTSAEQGGPGQIWMIVLRKAQTNIRVFSGTNWSKILVAALAFIGFMRFRKGSDFADTLAENRYFGFAIVATLTAGAVAFFTEDSGIVIPALIMLYTALGLVWLMLRRIPQSGEAGQ